MRGILEHCFIAFNKGSAVLRKHITRDIIVRAFMVCFVAVALWNVFRCIQVSGGDFRDFRWRWQECAYTLRGINPMDVVKGVVPVNDAIGALPPNAGTVPWGYALGNVLTFGFLPYSYAKIIGMLTFPLLCLIAGFYTFKYVSRSTGNRLFGVLAALLIPCVPTWVGSFGLGNGGATLSCLLLLMVLFVDQKPYLAGVLLGVATIKPQLAGIFYLSLLMQKRVKTLITASSLVAVSWLVAALLTDSSPLAMLLETNAQGMNPETYRNTNFGIVGLFMGYIGKAGCLPRHYALALSALFGVAFVITLSVLALKNPALRNNTLFFYAIPAVASTFWFYKQPHDFCIIFILAIAFLQTVATLKCTRFSIVLFAAFFGLYARQATYHRYFLLTYFFWMAWLLLLYSLYAQYPLSRRIQKLMVKDAP